MVSAVGAPYDTMESVIGITGNAPGNLISKGVHYKEVPLKGNTYDLQAISDAVDENTKLVEIQRSRGYMLRDSLFPSDMKKIIDTVKAKNPDTICFVDNCYGEFTNKEEPIELGADITAGSLIKNAGGGLAPTGAISVAEKTGGTLLLCVDCTGPWWRNGFLCRFLPSFLRRTLPGTPYDKTGYDER